MSHPLLKQSFIDKLRNGIRAGQARKLYSVQNFKVSEDNLISSSAIDDPGEVKLLMPTEKLDYDFENAKIIFNAYKNLTLAKASDQKFWTYLTHVRYWKYMKKRWPFDKSDLDEQKIKRYILEHWHINGVNATTLIRNGISWLWWGVQLTYDVNRPNSYELTEELFSMKDYTRTLLPSIQGRNNIFTRALLKYVHENPKLFSSNKETKTRILSKYLNRRGGHVLLPTLSETELLTIFSKYETQITKVTGRESLSKP